MFSRFNMQLRRITSGAHTLTLACCLAGVWLSLSAATFADETPPSAALPVEATAAPIATATDHPTPVKELPVYFNADPTNLSPADPTGGSAGYWTTPAEGPVGDGDPRTKKPEELYDRIAHNTFSINMVWTLIAGFLVMFMQAGFALVETGLCRAKNAAHTMGMNMMVYPLGCFAFWVYGFALGWGNWFNGPVAPGWYSALGPGTSQLNSGYSLQIGEKAYGLVGTKGFCLQGFDDDVSVIALFFFMMVFFDTTATIPTGVMAERWAWKNFCFYGLWVAIPYCLFANWVWGGGWLAQMGVNWGLGHGAVDFAGSGVVHAMGGVLGLAGGIVLGPRLGKYVNGKPMPLPGHNVPMVILGTFILAFGWFGFNPGSTLSGTDLRISIVVVNTMLASVGGALGTALTLKMKGMKPDPTMICNGMLAGLVAITAPCAFVDTWAAMVIGLLAGLFVVISVFFWEGLGIDDPCGAISVHGVNGIWGVISLGLFANGKYGMGWNGVNREPLKDRSTIVDGVRGLFYGDPHQLYAQLISAGTVIVFGFVMGMIMFKLSNLITPIRCSEETEMAGLDIPEMGVHGYPSFHMKNE